MNQYYQLRLAGNIIRILPRRFAYRLSDLLAALFCARDYKGRTTVIANLRRVYSHTNRPTDDATLERAARATFRYFGRYLVDFFFFSRLTRNDLDRYIVMENTESLAWAHERGRGTLLVTAHLGNWELGGAVVAALGHTIYAIALPQKDARLDRYFQEQRRRRGMRLLFLGRAVRDIIDVLNRNETVALLADRDYTGHNDMTPFFGAEAPMPRGPAWLASHTGTTLVPGFLLRRDDDRYCMRFGAPFVPEQGMPLPAIQQHLCAVLEEEIGRNPCQWYMFQEIWGGRGYGSGPPKLT